MFEPSFEKRVKINQIIENQVPEFLLSESPKVVDFLKQYYISQEYQGGPVDLVENLDQYIKLDNLTPEVITGYTSLTSDISSTDTVIYVQSTKGFPSEYGLLKIDDEIITYTGISTNSFTGCIRGFSGVTGYENVVGSGLSIGNERQLIFSSSSSSNHTNNSTVNNLSSLFLKEFYKKLKYYLTPGLEDNNFTTGLNVSNFIKEARSFYQAKGIEESFRILFNVLYDDNATVLNLDSRLIKPSSASYIRRLVLMTELISGQNPLNLVGQTINQSTDSVTQASVSNIEAVTREGKLYYKISLFIGYDDRSLIDGKFDISGKTKALENVSVGSSIISVDSTIGFGQTGTLISGYNQINYTSKTINQFFGCSGIIVPISQTDDIKSTEVIYGYENGDTSKKVELRITGVLSNFVPISDISLADEGEIISIRSIGESIKNPESNKTYKEIFANSWVYNTSSRYQVSDINGSTFTLLSKIDKSSLKVGDYVDILERNSNNIVISGAQVDSLLGNNQIRLNTFSTFTPVYGLYYDIRRKIKKATSSPTAAQLQFGNNALISDVLNVYSDFDSYGYVASNSLPDYPIYSNITKAIIPDASGFALQGYDSISKQYSVLSFDVPNVPFITGDRVVYEASNINIPGLVSGQVYYVQIVDNYPNQIRLYSSKSLLYTSYYEQFNPLPTGSGSHTFILEKHRKELIGTNPILRKFPFPQNISNTETDKKNLGGVGILVNGVEIINPESDDRVYYGPLSNFTVLNSGQGYDVINPPTIQISAPDSGTTAQVIPVVSGIVSSVFVDPQDFDVQDVLSVTLTGGNGSGCILEPVMGERYREVLFDSRQLLFGGGIDIDQETISFQTPHKFQSGETIIYDQNGNYPLQISSYRDSNNPTGTLVSGSSYVAKVINPITIQLYNTISDYNSGINTIGIATNTYSGIQKFRTISKNTLRSIKVLNPGSGYQYRHLYVPPSGISTQYSTVSFTNHGFNSGDLIQYYSTGNTISGISTFNQYYVIKVDNNSFKLADAGIGASITSNYSRNKTVIFGSTGSGFNVFKYPDISVSVNVAYGTTIAGNFVITPVVTGQIIDAYMYDPGSGYGSNSLNLERKPLVTLSNGKDAQLKPIVSGGKISYVEVLSKGSHYNSPPDLEVTGSGSGAILRAVVQNGQLVSVVVINSGIGYSSSDTSVKVNVRGHGALFDVNIRSLALNNQYRYNQEFFLEKGDHLTYNILGYSEDLGKNVFSDYGNSHSPIIGWAYDGNPIYGPYGYSDAKDNTSPIKILKSGYSLSPGKINSRPSTSVFAPGFFIDDYQFDNMGDLDICNGRFCKTPDFPNGVYAYFVGVSTSPITNKLEPQYPYFIGDYYRSPFIMENILLDQTFDFNNSNLTRNTLPYKVRDLYAGNDFITESYGITNQLSTIESITKGSVETLEIIDGGENYQVGDYTIFNNVGTNGGGLNAVVSSVSGKTINQINTSLQRYTNSIFIWNGNDSITVYQPFYNTFNNNDAVRISGLTSSITGLTGTFNVGIVSSQVQLLKAMPANPYGGNPYTGNFTNGGVTADIYVSGIPNTISIGSSLLVDNEVLTVLNIFPEGSCLRVKRHIISVGHSIGSTVNVLPNRFTINVQTPQFDSKINDMVYFNALQSVGMGTTPGISISSVYTTGDTSVNISIPTQTIYLPNHPFKTGQKVTISKNPAADSIIVGNTADVGSTFYLPDTFSAISTAYVINKSKDYIGLATQVGLTTNTNGLFFFSAGVNDAQYLISSNFNQVKGTADRIVANVITNSSHGLHNGDTIFLEVKPNGLVGIGSTNSVVIAYNQDFAKLLVGPVGFDSSQISVSTDSINIPSHGFETGDKVLYTSNDQIAAGLNTGVYFAYKVDSDNISLSETLFDVTSKYPSFSNIVGVGGSHHQLAKINPRIDVIKDNSIVFNLSDPSLVGSKLKIFYDSGFNKEFLSTEETSSFNVIRQGSPGIDSGAKLVVNYSEAFPSKLFYALERSGYISTSDTEVINGSEIIFTNSSYTDSYPVFGIGTNTFNIALNKVPESLNHSQYDCNVLRYSTPSTNVVGPVNSLRILSNGANYKKLPTLEKINSINGKNANIAPYSNSIGRIKNVRVLDIGYEYSSDKTLKPEAFISPIVSLDNSDTIANISILYGGAEYISPPSLILYNPVANTVVDTTSLTATVQNSNVSSVNILGPIYGLQSTTHRVIAVDNSNGVGISSMVGSSSGIVTCTLLTPLVGFHTSIFNIGDQIFVEGVQKISSDGTGYNSSDYGYQFLTVTAFQNTNPAQLEYSLAGLTTNPGIAKTYQSGYATIVNKNFYPVFSVDQERSLFAVGEQLYTNLGSGFIVNDVYITKSRPDYIKIKGSYDLSIGEVIKGKTSGVIATVKNISENKGLFLVDYGSRQDIGWSDSTGKLDEDYQVTPDNDYYQNLSYSVKSTIEYDTFVDPVKRLLHPTGLKGFADTQVFSRVSSASTYQSKTEDVIILDVYNQKRIDNINNFDLDLDYDTLFGENKSKYLIFKNKKLANYALCKTNRVLTIDDISGKFSNIGNFLPYVDISPINDNFQKYLVQITNLDTFDTQISEVVVIDTQADVFTFEKETLYTTPGVLGDISAQIDEFSNKTLRFTPADIYNSDYDIKVLNLNFNTDLAGIGTYSIGSVDLSGNNVIVASGAASTIFSKSLTSFNGLFSNIEIFDTIQRTIEYAEVTLGYDGSNVYLSEYYFDSIAQSYSTQYVGFFTSFVDPVSNTVSLQFYNDKNNPMLVRCNNVGFGTTSVGIGTYRYLIPGQSSGTERTIRLENTYGSGSSPITVCNLNINLDSSVKSLVRVSSGNTSAMHQVLMTQNRSDVFVVQYPFVSIGSTSGIGTFGGNISGDNVTLLFYPDPIFNNTKVQSYNEILYTQNDYDNSPAPLQYGTVNQTLLLAPYNGFNGTRANKVDFDLRHNGDYIYKKVFNPSDATQLNPVTGIFSIPNHFFSTGEQLTYLPVSTFAGVGATAVGIGSTLSYLGIVTNRLPDTVYPIVIDADHFKISTRQEYATAGIFVTFTSYGQGNAHEFQMQKVLERSVISLDGIVQQPITYTPITQTLFNNGGSIGAAVTTFSLSGISTIQPRDVLKIDDEYMKVISVGFGTTSVGPITNLGSYNLVSVKRGSIGSSATSHTDGKTARVYRGSFNIVGSRIYFLDAPVGNTRSVRDNSNLPYVIDVFNGRTFLRSDYSTDILFDDISDQFTGIGKTFTLKSQGQNVSGLTLGNGILFINGVFQTPSTLNNLGNNYTFTSSAGISSVVFTGITSANGQLVQSTFDVNQNQVPRGGLVVSLGSTPGLGYAPLVGASVTAVLNPSTGSIVSVGFGTTDILGSGYRGVVSIGITQYSGHTGTDAVITATVGAGGTLAFNIINGGTGYTNPVIQIPNPIYENLPIIGVSRLGIGATTDTGYNTLITVDVGGSNTTGIGSTLFQVSSFAISRPGYGFKVGDVFKPVGLVTAKGLSAPISEFQLTVTQVFNDYFSAWQFGEMDHFDSIKPFQDGHRVRFPLYYNSSLISFEVDPNDPVSAKIDLNAVLVIFVNGVLQVPGTSYQFDGGTSFVFTQPPDPSDDIQVFFYLGTRGVDILTVNVPETVKIGDTVSVYKNPNYPSTQSQTNGRVVMNIPNSDSIETDIYVGLGVDPYNYKPIEWQKQKVDTAIKGDIVYKTRDSLESSVYPTAKIIKDITPSSTSIFVDDAQFFRYESNNFAFNYATFDALMVPGLNPVGAAFSATVGINSSISSISILNPGSGYSGSSVNLAISNPKSIGVGIGTTATATANIISGSIVGVNTTNYGFGYDINHPPYVIAPIPAYNTEKVTLINNVQGFSGIITGITTTTGTGGNPRAIRFFFRANAATASDLSVGYPICIVDTKVGSGVTSIDSSDSSVVGIGTSFLDNIYYVHSISNLGPNAQIVCNVRSDSPILGINTSGTDLGRLSWGRLYNFTRSTSPISLTVSGLTVDSGLTTFPSIQRRSVGLRNTGALKKDQLPDL